MNPKETVRPPTSNLRPRPVSGNRAPDAPRKVFFELSQEEYGLLNWTKNYYEPMATNRWLRAQVLKTCARAVRQSLDQGRPVKHDILEAVKKFEAEKL